MSADRTEVLVIGDGIIGLAVALELARRGSVCRIVGGRNPGAASSAAAGLLAPSLGHLQPAVRTFHEASLDRYPAFLESLQPFDGTLRLMEGLIQVGAPADAPIPKGARRLSADDLAALEPNLVPSDDAFFHPRDGAVDSVRVLDALGAAAADHQRVTLDHDPAVRLERSPGECAVVTMSGARITADQIVVAAGAWTPHVGGLPRQLPIEPVKGQMLALDATPLRHAVYGPGAYVVPRRTETVVGATSEQAGFDVSTSRDVIDALRDAAIRLAPSLATARVSRAWAGFRPATPDLLPILGRDPADARVVYACGHSRNGILLAPATAACIASVVRGEPVELDLEPFKCGRLDR